jgi:hypothetical protein
MERTLKDRFGIIAAFALVIALNFLSNALPLNGTTMSEISAGYPTLFTPAGFTFAIWGVIYLALLGFVIFQALPAQKDNALLAKISPLFILNCIANAAWIVVWHYGFLWISLLVMGVILSTLVLIYRAIRAARPALSIAQWVFVSLPFSLYVGWITAATIANFSIVQYANGWNDAGLTAVNWTFLKLAIAGAIGATMIVRRGDIAFVLVIAWAAFGIASKQAGTPEIAGAASVLSLLVLLLAVLEGVRKLRGLRGLEAA